MRVRNLLRPGTFLILNNRASAHATKRKTNMKRIAALALGSALVLSACATTPAQQRQVGCVGASTAGALAGALVGNQIGGGRGNDIATAGGAVAGGLAAGQAAGC
jgi:outer membrane lipoprotein SlyB